jgi:hypothetical protein
MTKKTCTPHRKALAKRFKSGEFKKHANGGSIDFLQPLIDDKTYNVQLAQTNDQKEKGLQGVTELPEDEGMLFIFEDEDPDYDGTVSF